MPGKPVLSRRVHGWELPQMTFSAVPCLAPSSTVKAKHQFKFQRDILQPKCVMSPTMWTYHLVRVGTQEQFNSLCCSGVLALSLVNNTPHLELSFLFFVVIFCFN